MKTAIMFIASAMLLVVGAGAQTADYTASAKTPTIPTTRPASASSGMVYDVRIELALFGSGTHLADVTDRVIELLRSEPQAISANTAITPNMVMGFTATAANLHIDPTPGKNKSLLIRYRWHDHERLFMVTGGQRASYAAMVVEDDANN